MSNPMTKRLARVGGSYGIIWIRDYASCLKISSFVGCERSRLVSSVFRLTCIDYV